MAATPSDDRTADAVRTLLERGLEAGIVTRAQRDALVALHAAAGAVPLGDHARRWPDAVTVAYGVGAALVVFALAWFLADRWGTLGPTGVLAIAAGYAVLFGVTSLRLARAGFPLASGVACALATLTAPLAAWALMRLTGEWPDGSAMHPLLRYEPYLITRRLVVELTSALAVLLVLRSVPAGGPMRRTPLAIPLAVAAGAGQAAGAGADRARATRAPRSRRKHATLNGVHQSKRASAPDISNRRERGSRCGLTIRPRGRAGDGRGAAGVGREAYASGAPGIHPPMLRPCPERRELRSA